MKRILVKIKVAKSIKKSPTSHGKMGGRDSSVGKATRHRFNISGFESQCEIFLTHPDSPPLPPTTTTTTMSPVQWVPCLISREWSGQGVAFTTLPLLSPMLRMGRAIPLPSSPPKCPLGTAFAYIYGTWNVTVVATMTNFSVLGEPNPHNHAGLRHSVNQNADLLSSQSGQRSNFRNTKQSDRKFDE